MDKISRRQLFLGTAAVGAAAVVASVPVKAGQNKNVPVPSPVPPPKNWRYDIEHVISCTIDDEFNICSVPRVGDFGPPSYRRGLHQRTVTIEAYVEHVNIAALYAGKGATVNCDLVKGPILVNSINQTGVRAGNGDAIAIMIIVGIEVGSGGRG